MHTAGLNYPDARSYGTILAPMSEGRLSVDLSALCICWNLDGRRTVTGHGPTKSLAVSDAKDNAFHAYQNKWKVGAR